MKKVQLVSLLTLILGICMIIPGWLWMNTSAVGSLSANQQFDSTLSPTNLASRSDSFGNWALPPNEVTIIASINANGHNTTNIPSFLELYHELVQIEIEIEDAAGLRSTPAGTHLEIEFRNETEATETIYIGHGGSFEEIQLPSITRFWINVSIATENPINGSIITRSEIFVAIKIMLMYEPIEHDIALGLFFTGIAFMAESFVIFVTEFAREWR